MASAAATLKMAAVAGGIGIALVLLAMAAPATADDVISECSANCRPACQGFSEGACMGIVKRSPNLLAPTCLTQVTSVCATFCFKLCTLDTLPDLSLSKCLQP